MWNYCLTIIRMRAAHFNKVSSCPVIIIARLITVKYLLGNDAKNSRKDGKSVRYNYKIYKMQDQRGDTKKESFCHRDLYIFSSVSDSYQMELTATNPSAPIWQPAPVRTWSLFSEVGPEHKGTMAQIGASIQIVISDIVRTDHNSYWLYCQGKWEPTHQLF